MPPRPSPAGSLLPPLQELHGLDEQQARQRLQRHGANVLPGTQARGWWTMAAALLREPMLLMLLAAGAIYAVLGDRGEAGALLGFVVVVIGITLAQQRKTERALAALREMSAPRACVVRDGVERRIAAREVVPGDLLLLREGDRIAADARVLHGLLQVDESLLSGESAPVDRGAAQPGRERAAELFAGTQVTQGVAVAEVLATGGATAMGGIGAGLAAAPGQLSRLQRSTLHLVRRVALLAWLCALALVLIEWRLRGQALLPSVLAGIALAMALLPEEIPVVLTVFLGLGAWRMARRQVLARSIPAVEALGSITVLAADKTGTLTANRMRLALLRTPRGSFDTAAPQDLPEEFHALLEFALLATPADPFDPMERAIGDVARQRLHGTEHLHEHADLRAHYPLSPDMLAMTRVISTDPRRPGLLLAAKGAPEAIVDLCHLDVAAAAAVRDDVERMAARGLRVLAVARGSLPGAPAQDAWPQSQHDFQFGFLGLLGFFDPPREGVAQAVAQCRGAGVRVLMLTGDHPATACAVAAQLGLGDGARMLRGDDIDALDDAELARRLRDTDLCARLQPRHKLRLVRALQREGEVVAMTGDGVNDAPALKAADVGVAMGERGTDVAREAAALVLLDDAFGSIVAALREGRRIRDNLARAVRFIAAVHVPVVALALLPPLLGWPALLLPLHIVLLQLIIDPACSLLFEAEPAAPELMLRPPEPPDANPLRLRGLLPALAQGLGLACLLLAGSAWLLARGWSAADARTTVFVALVGGVLLLIHTGRARRPGARRTPHADAPPNPWPMRIGLGAAGMLTAALLLPGLRGLMGFGPPRWPMLGAAVALVLGSQLWLLALRVLRQRRR